MHVSLLTNFGDENASWILGNKREIWGLSGLAAIMLLINFIVYQLMTPSTAAHCEMRSKKLMGKRIITIALFFG